MTESIPALVVLTQEDQKLLDKALSASTEHLYGFGKPETPAPPTRAEIAQVQPAPAGMPGVEGVARAIAQADEQNGGPPYEYRIATGKHAREQLFDEARAVLALFAPLAQENEKLKGERDAAIQEAREAVMSMLYMPGVRAALDKLPPDDPVEPYLELARSALSAEARATEAEARGAQAVEALEEFDDALCEDDEGYPDDTPVAVKWRAHTVMMKLGDFRRARTAAAAIRGGEK